MTETRTAPRSGAASGDPALGGRSLRLVMLVLAFACGASVANLYYAQPLLGLIRQSFGLSSGTAALAVTLRQAEIAAPQSTSWGAGILAAVATNLLNNLPVGLIAATIGQAAQVPLHVTGAILIGVDLGPNLSVTGSLATILWLIVLRREGEHVGAMQFLKLGIAVMPPALLLALAALSIVPP